MKAAAKIREIIHRHRWAFLVSVLVGLVYISLHFFMMREAMHHGAVYIPVIIEGGFDEGYYALRAAEAFEGRLLVGDINLAENGDSPAFLPILNPLIMATLGGLAGSIENAFILSDFVFIFIISIIIYFVAFEFTGRRVISIVFATLFMFAPKLALIPSSGVIPFIENARELYFSRFEYPNVTFMFFGAALYFLIRSLKRDEPLTVVFAGIFVGSLFYTYLYDWLYVYTALGLMAIFFALSGRAQLCKKILRIGGIGLLISIPYWINFLKLTSLPTYADVVERIGVERGRHFRFEVVWFSYIRAIVLVVLLWCLGFVRKQKVILPILAALVLPIIFLLNIQVITGFVPHPDHFHRTQFFGIALVWLILFIALMKAWTETVFRIPKGAKKIIAGIVVVGCLIFGVINNRTLALESAPLYYKDPAYIEAYLWLKNKTPRDSVIASISSRTNNEIILYTDNTIFVPNGLHTIASTEEIWKRMMLASKMFDLTPQEFERAVVDQTLYLFTDRYRNDGFNNYFKRTIRKIPDEILATKKAEYAALAVGADFSSILKPHYFIVGERERALGADETYLKTIARVVHRSKGIVIYVLDIPRE